MKKILSILMFPYIIWGGMLPEEVLTDNCLSSYNENYKLNSNHKAFVYTRNEASNADKCYWRYGYGKTEDAIALAMKDCQEVILDAECKLVDTDGVFKVDKGMFSAVEPVGYKPLTKEEKITLSEKAKGLVIGDCFPLFEEDYFDAKGHKAFAYSVDIDGTYACGYSYRHATKDNAYISALASCNDDRRKRGCKASQTSCKIYAEGNSILLKASDFGIEKILKKEIPLSSEAYTKKWEQSKTMIDKGACLFQMKYYLKGMQQQAFYFMKSDGKQACGRVESAFTLEAAKKKAKESCNQMAKDKNIKAECILFAQNFEIIATPDTFK